MSVVSIDAQNRIFLRKVPIGYLNEEKSAVVDFNALASYANRWLMQHGYKIEWKAGVIQELEKQLQQEPAEEEARVRIYQMENGRTLREKRYASYDRTIERFGKIDPADYQCVFDGSLGTENLEEIFYRLNRGEKPSGYTGRSLSVSDVIELIRREESSFHFVDSYGFQEIPFEVQNQPIQKNDFETSM